MASTIFRISGSSELQHELGISQRVYQAKSTQDYVPNLSTFARQGYDLTIGVGFTEATAIDTVATNFPQSNFAIVDVDQTEEPHKPANLLGLLFKEQETGYLVGYLAGLEEKRRPGKDVIGSVGGQKQPPVDRFIAGYQAGAKAADPGITVLNNYSRGLLRSGEVQADRPEPDRAGRRRDLPGRRGLRTRCARCGEGKGCLGDRRRRGPVFPRSRTS